MCRKFVDDRERERIQGYFDPLAMRAHSSQQFVRREKEKHIYSRHLTQRHTKDTFFLAVIKRRREKTQIESYHIIKT